MSEPVTKQRPTVNLDDFEREMRDAHHHNDDPLAELARLVGEQHDPYGDVFAREAQAPAYPIHQPPAYSAPAHADQDGRREPGFNAPQAPLSPRFSGDFAAIEAGLRGTTADHGGYTGHQTEPTFDERYEPSHDQNYGDAQGYGEPAAHDPAYGQPARAAKASRRPMVLLAATIAVGVIGIGTAFALKGHISTSPREVKTILADESPTKVQPPADAADNQASQDPAVMGKGQQVPTALANREEQPVDLLQAARENAAAQARRTDASSVPVPPSPGQVQTAMADPSSMGQSFPIGDMPEPKRVRVVSVRPDGTILPNDNPPPAAIPAPRAPAGKTSDRAGPVAKPSTPKAVASKTTSRVTTPKSIDQLADAPDDAAPAPAAAKVKKPKPQRVASADTGEAEATQVVSPEPEASGSGGFAVQLAAPGSEADAKSTSSKLAKKFAGPLAGHHLGFHKAESNGKSVFRVRVSSLSKPEAVSLCEKLKADGGSCFVAKN